MAFASQISPVCRTSHTQLQAIVQIMLCFPISDSMIWFHKWNKTEGWSEWKILVVLEWWSQVRTQRVSHMRVGEALPVATHVCGKRAYFIVCIRMRANAIEPTWNCISVRAVLRTPTHIIDLIIPFLMTLYGYMKFESVAIQKRLLMNAVR